MISLAFWVVLAYYVIFLSDRIEGSILSTPQDAIMGVFLMSLGDFGSTYESFEALSPGNKELARVRFIRGCGRC